jgi:hypothetical protein
LRGFSISRLGWLAGATQKLFDLVAQRIGLLPRGGGRTTLPDGLGRRGLRPLARRFRLFVGLDDLPNHRQQQDSQPDYGANHFAGVGQQQLWEYVKHRK